MLPAMRQRLSRLGNCAGEIEDDSAGDWIHKTGLYSCMSNGPDNCGAWTCAEPADSAA